LPKREIKARGERGRRGKKKKSKHTWIRRILNRGGGKEKADMDDKSKKRKGRKEVTAKEMGDRGGNEVRKGKRWNLKNKKRRQKKRGERHCSQRSRMKSILKKKARLVG